MFALVMAMPDPDYIETKLSLYTEATLSDHEVRDNRYYYLLGFDTDIGFDWLEQQVSKAAGKVGVDLDIYEVGPVEDAPAFVVEVRELQRREGIDDGQRGLDEFERKG